MRGLFKASLLVVGVRTIGIGLQSIIVVLLARFLLPSEMGVFALCYAVVGLARMLGPLGTDQTTMRVVAQDLAAGGLNDAGHELLNCSMILVVAANMLIAVLFAVAGQLAGNAMVGSVADTGFAVLWTALALPPFAVIGLLTLQLRGFGQQVWAQFPDSILLQMLHGGLLLVLWQGGMLTLSSSLMALAVSAWLVAALYVITRLRLGVRRIMPQLATYRRLMGEAWNVWAALSITALSVRAPLFIAAAMLGPAAAAVLDIATRFGTLSSITTSSVMATFSPRFATLSGKSQRSELSRTLSLAALLAVAPAVLILLVLVFAAPLVIERVLPATYQQAYVPMLILCLAQLVNSWLGPATNMLLMVRHGDIVRNFSAIQLVLVIAVSLAAANQVGLVGVTVAILVTQFIRDFGSAFWAQTRMGVALPPFGLT